MACMVHQKNQTELLTVWIDPRALIGNGSPFLPPLPGREDDPSSRVAGLEPAVQTTRSAEMLLFVPSSMDSSAVQLVDKRAVSERSRRVTFAPSST